MRRIGVALLLAATFAAGLVWGTFVAGGSDSFCYLFQARQWSSGRLQVPDSLALEAPWPDAPLTFAPAGHVPSALVPGAIVPACPAGLSVAMAPFIVIGGVDAAFLVVPLFGALLVGTTYAAGSPFGPRIGVASALVAAAAAGAAMFGAGVAIACAAVALINQALYGSMLRSGCGPLARLFDVAHVVPNAMRYTTWLTETQTPAWLLAAAAPVLLPGALTRPAISRTSSSMTGPICDFCCRRCPCSSS